MWTNVKKSRNKRYSGIIAGFRSKRTKYIKE